MNRASNRWLGQIAINWRIGSFISIERGTTVFVSSLNDLASSGGGSGKRPNASGRAASLGDVDLADGVEYFNAGAFSRTPQFVFGNVSRTLPDVRLPRNWGWDTLIEKRFRIDERVTIDFRSEFFNMTNSVIFDGPNTSIIAVRLPAGRLATNILGPAGSDTLARPGEWVPGDCPALADSPTRPGTTRFTENSAGTKWTWTAFKKSWNARVMTGG